ncbi:MAG: peptide deformylase [Chloroflexota bacterium]|nr:peptide deformylase [Chloroflexota bacterium]
MAVLKIVKHPHPVLHERVKAVPRVTGPVRDLIDGMLETMYAASGVGLAAPQVGVSQRVIVADVGEGPIILVNPERVYAEGEQVSFEGCLSVPGLVGEVRRAERVVVRGLNRKGEAVTVMGRGLLARALQHEIDHLDGILYLERVEDASTIHKVSELEAEGEEKVTSI